MKYSFLLISGLLLFGLNKSHAQKSAILKIESRSWETNKNGSFKFVAHSQRKIVHTDSLIVLKSGDTITRYIFQKYFFTKSVIPDKNYISVLVGTDSKYVPLLVLDKNFNNSFSDDSVYKFFPSRTFENEREFYDSLPVISVDSLKIGPCGENKYVQLKMAPYFQGAKFLNNEDVIKSAKKYALSFYVTNFLSADFEINSQLFKLEIIPHPLSFPIYNQTNLAQADARWNFMIYKMDQGGKEENVDWGVYQDIVDHLKDTSHAIKILNKYLLINAISLDSNKISVSIIDSAVYAKSKTLSPANHIQFSNFHAFSINKKKQVDYDFSKNKLTLVEFSGSWCVPCAQILPDLRRMYNKYSGKMAFVSIMEEGSKSDAEKYFKNHNLPWMLFYENIADTGTVKVMMNVHVYPSFFLVNQKGEIIFRHSTAGGMDEIERKIIEQLVGNL